jgi:1-acyl-sn-glycerol-3-phosphate acyltransferase
MNILNAARLAIFILSTLPPIGKHKQEIDRARAAGDHAREQEWIRLAENDWGPRVLRHYGVKAEVTGERTLPDGAVFFVSNHEGYGDIPLFMDAIRSKQFGFVAKGELAEIPLFNKWIVRIRSLMLLRDDPREALRVFAEGEKWLRQGFSLVMFPEGTRAKGQGMKPFQKGTLRMALRTGVPIVPVSIQGSWECFEAHGFPRRGVIRIHIHSPVGTAGVPKSEEAALSNQVEAVIRAKIEEWRAEPQTAQGKDRSSHG